MRFHDVSKLLSATKKGMANTVCKGRSSLPNRQIVPALKFGQLLAFLPQVTILIPEKAADAYPELIERRRRRPDSQIENFTAYYQLVELATGKTVVNDLTYGHVSYDIPGSQQRFAGQRARRDAEDRAIQVAADAIRNRLASYFVAGT